MSSQANALHGKIWTAVDGKKPHSLPQASLHPSLFYRLLHHRFELPDWGKFKMTDSGRFSMPYAMLAIMVSLLAIVAAACVTVALAALGAGFWLVTNVTEIKTTMNQVARAQTVQESKIDGLKAYVNIQTRESDMVKNLLSPQARARVEQWELANPKPDLSRLGQPQN